MKYTFSDLDNPCLFIVSGKPVQLASPNCSIKWSLGRLLRSTLSFSFLGLVSWAIALRDPISKKQTGMIFFMVFW